MSQIYIDFQLEIGFGLLLIGIIALMTRKQFKDFGIYGPVLALVTMACSFFFMQEIFYLTMDSIHQIEYIAGFLLVAVFD